MAKKVKKPKKLTVDAKLAVLCQIRDSLNHLRDELRGYFGSRHQSRISGCDEISPTGRTEEDIQQEAYQKRVGE